jgi:flagellar M-ring protein FliF
VTLAQIYALIVERILALPPKKRWIAGSAVVVATLGLAFLAKSGIGGDSMLLGGQVFGDGELKIMESVFENAGLSGFKVKGGKVSVPRGQEAKFMGALADAEALPAGFGRQVGHSEEASRWFETSADRKERLRRAKENELATWIRAMDGIEQAAVMVDEHPPRGLRQESSAKASVSVKPLGHASLQEQQVRAIRQMIAGAFSNLSAADVTVVDLNTNRHFSGVERAVLAIDDPYAQRKALYVSWWEEQIRKALPFVPGMTVSVNVELDSRAVGPTTDPASGQPAAAGGPLPHGVTVSVGLPRSYFENIWKKRHPAASPSVAPDPKEVARIETEETANFRRAVVGLMPLDGEGGQPQSAVTLFSFEDLPQGGLAAAPPAGWQLPQWLTAGITALASMGAAAWMVIKRKNSASAGPADGPAVPMPDPHRAGPSIVSADGTVREAGSQNALLDELADMARRDPKAAAGVLRAWVADAG